MNLRTVTMVSLLAACGRTPPAVQDSGTPSASGVGPDASAAPPTASSSAPAAVETEALDASDDGPYLRGATWVTCKDNFRAESTPERNLYRLGLLCGPNHGLRREGEMVRGSLKQGAMHRYSFMAKRDQCFRVMATWEPPLQRVSVRVLDPGGALAAQTESDVRWLLAAPQGAVCAERSGDYQIELRAVQGEGKFAAQLWVLR